MANAIFKRQEDITEKWLFYIENEATALKEADDRTIQRYTDTEAFNPEMDDFLELKSTKEALAGIEDDDEPLAFNHTEFATAKKSGFAIKPGFKKLKKKIKKVFCEVVRRLEDVDAKDIIKAVLLALIPAFTAGIPLILLPLIIGIIASFLKYGLDQVCPV